MSTMECEWTYPIGECDPAWNDYRAHVTIASSGRRSFGGLLGRAVPATTWSAKSICAGLHYRRPGSDTFTCRVDGHSPTSTTPRGGGRDRWAARGGGGGTAYLSVGTHCQTTVPAFRRGPPLSLVLPPPIFEGLRPTPPKSNIIKIQIYLQKWSKVFYTAFYIKNVMYFIK